MKLAKDSNRPIVGRPKMNEKELNRQREIVRLEWLEQGKTGWRPVKASLPEIGTRLIQKVISELKENDRRKIWKAKREVKRLEVNYKNIVWAQDTTLTRDGLVEVVKDRSTLKYLKAAGIESMSAENVLSVLDESINSEGCPLILMTDNGSGYKSKKMAEYLRKKKVIHLKSLPRCPQHNGAVERAIGEFKRVKKEMGVSNQEVLSLLNTKRRYASKNFLTCEEIERESIINISMNDRKRIYAEYENKILKLEKREPNFRKRRMKEREIVFDLLEKEGLIKRVRGSRNY